MFSRFFRRGKKKEPPVKKEDSMITDDSQGLTEGDTIDDKAEIQSLEEYSVPETPFEEKFSDLPQIISETITEEIEPSEPFEQVLPLIKPLLEEELSINGFISPEYLASPLIELEQTTSEATIVSAPKIEYPPITIEEKIEGALFSIGRPIHVTTLIESLEEESPNIKRALRKLQRRRKRSSSILVEEISKDRWVLQLNPIYNDFFSPFIPGKFMEPDERRVLTEICYRQPISLGMLKKLIQGIGPVKITELCKQLEVRGYITGEKKARSLVYSSTPKFAHDFGFDDESRRLKLQMLWRLKRLMGDYEVEEEEIEEPELEDEQKEEEEKVKEDKIDEELIEEEEEKGEISESKDEEISEGHKEKPTDEPDIDPNESEIKKDQDIDEDDSELEMNENLETQDNNSYEEL